MQTRDNNAGHSSTREMYLLGSRFITQNLPRPYQTFTDSTLNQTKCSIV